MVRGTGFGRSPVNQETHIGSKDLRMPEKTHGRSLRWCRGVGGLLELLGWPVAQGRMQPDTIVVLLDERLDIGAQVIEIAILVGVDFLSLQRFHKALATRIGQGSQLQLMATLPTVVLKSRIHIIR